MTIKHKTEYASHYRNDQTLNKVRVTNITIKRLSVRVTCVTIKRFTECASHKLTKNQLRNRVGEALT